jgi:sigma-E factor negative regulatory protein RseB
MGLMPDFAMANAWMRWRAVFAGVALWLCAAMGPVLVAQAQTVPGPAASALPPLSPVSPVRDIGQWIERMHQAPRNRSYVGTFVVLSSSGAMFSSRIWNACDGKQQVERVDGLSGTPRKVFRRNDEVRTFLPQERTVRTERGDARGLFPQMPSVEGVSLARHYEAQVLGQERVAGLDADVVWFKPLDPLRFGYRIWSERTSGLVVKMQTLATDGRVLEQAAFSELDFDAPVPMDKLSRMMDDVAGYKVIAPAVVKTTAQEEGWRLRQPVAGFVAQSCHKRAAATSSAALPVLQCLYSDGLATVSLFVEPFDAQRHGNQGQLGSMGATQMLGQRMVPDAWVTAVGEVPMQTLRLFVGALERTR